MAKAGQTNENLEEGAEDMTPEARAKSAADAGKVTKKSKEPQDAVTGNGGVVTPEKDRQQSGIKDIQKNNKSVGKDKTLPEGMEEDEDNDITTDDNAQEDNAVKKTKFEMTSELLRSFSRMDHSTLAGVYSNHFAEEVEVEEVEAKHITVAEDLGAMFEGEELTEEAKEKMTTIFEAAVQAKVAVEATRIEEELSEQMNNSVAAISEDLVENVDKYLTHAVQEYIEENRVAIEHNIRVDVAEEFIGGFKSLLEKHNIFVDADASNEINDLEEEIQTLKSTIKEGVDKEIALKEEVKSLRSEQVFNAISEGLAKTDVERFKTLAEGIEFVDEETYERKLKIVKENYFKDNTTVGDITEETVEGISESNNLDGDTRMQIYTAALSNKNK